MNPEYCFDEYVRNRLGLLTYVSTLDTYEILYANDALKKLLGVKDQEHIGQKCYKLIQGKDTPCSFCTNAMLKEGEDYKWYFYNESLHRHFALTDTLVPTEKGLCRMEFALDISDEMQQLDAMQDSQNLDRAIITCAESLLDHEDVDKAVHVVLTTVADYYQADRAYIFQIDSEAGTLSNTYEVCNLGASPEIQNLQDLPLDSIDRWREVLETKPCISIDSVSGDVDKNSLEGQILKAQGIRSLLVTPLLDDGEMTGFLGVDNPRYAVGNPALVSSAATFILDDFKRRGVAVDLLNAVSEMQRSLDMNQVTFTCAKILLNDTNISVALTSLLETIASYLGADRAYIFEHRKTEHILENTHIYEEKKQRDPLGPQKSSLPQIHLAPQTSSEDFFKNSYYYLRNWDKVSDETSCHQQIFKARGVESCILSPFQKNGALLGFLGVDNPRTNVDHQMLIATVATFIVNTLEKRGMLTQLEYLSFSDDLTGVRNRNAYLHKIKELRRRSLENLGVIFVDLNDLKSVNEMFGHGAGDGMILWCVKFLQCYVRDPIYRIGGDEFVCFLPGISQERFLERTGEIRKALGRMSYINLSLGAVWSQQVEDLDDLIFAADKQMYDEKERIHALSRENIKDDKEKRAQMQRRLNEINRAE